MTHHDVDCDQLHDRDTGVSEARQVTPGTPTAEALDLLELVPGGHHGLIRLTLAQWACVDRVRTALARRIPTPRQAP
jgi:hypothetical protein